MMGENALQIEVVGSTLRMGEGLRISSGPGLSTGYGSHGGREVDLKHSAEKIGHTLIDPTVKKKKYPTHLSHLSVNITPCLS